MITVDLAQQLLSAGLLWTPASGDRFVIPGRDMDDQIFHISELTVEVHQFDSGRVLGFNGTTEWALDSLDLTDVLWLPREDQLRAELGDRFVSLVAGDGGFEVTYDGVGGRHTFRQHDVECAFAHAVLHLLREN